MKTREMVKTGKLSPDDALASFAKLAKGGEFVNESILDWLKRRKGIHVPRKAQTKPRKSKRRGNVA